jgi:STE24 endopeptidase
LPFPRYVLFTDRLLDELTPDEVEAVFGHEVGHVRHRHMTLYVVFLGLSLAVFTGLAHAINRWLEATGRVPGFFTWLGEWETFISLLVMAVYVVFAFGFLSRRCEREADLFGCRAVSCGQPDCATHSTNQQQTVSTRTQPCSTGINTFVSALERVAVMNGMSRSKPGWLASWQHGTIARRVDFLERVRDFPAVGVIYRRKMILFKLAIVAILATTVGVLIWCGDLPWQ